MVILPRKANHDGRNNEHIRINYHAIRAIYGYEMRRAFRTPLHSILAPLIGNSLLCFVFVVAPGTAASQGGNTPRSAFIVPGVVMLAVFTEGMTNGSFGIFLTKFHGTVYEILSAPASIFEIVLAYVGAAASKTVLVGLIVLGAATVIAPLTVVHPIWMLSYLILIAVTFCLLGFIIGALSETFEQLRFIPMLVVAPLTFLGGAFYPVNILPPFWRSASVINPFVYLINGFRWTFFGTTNKDLIAGLAMACSSIAACFALLAWIDRRRYRTS